MTTTRQVTWGEAIVVAGFRCPGGIKGAVERIRLAVGDHIGTRNTFAKLTHVDDPAELAERDVFRAWLLLAALGEEPNGWGLADDVVPPVADAAVLRTLVRPEGLEPPTFCLVPCTLLTCTASGIGHLREGVTFARISFRPASQPTDLWVLAA